MTDETRFAGRCALDGCDHVYLGATREDIQQHIHDEHSGHIGTLRTPDGIRIEDLRTYDTELTEEQIKGLMDNTEDSDAGE